MNLTEFVDGLSLIEAQLGPPPASPEMFERWASIKLKPIANMEYKRWIEIAEAAVNELSYWNQLTTHWIQTKSRELVRPELKALPAAEIPRGTKCPDHVKVWMAEERKRFEQIPESERTNYWLNRGLSPAGDRSGRGVAITTEIRDEMHFIRDRLAREGPTPQEALLLGRDPIDIASMPVMPSVDERSPPPPSEPIRYVNQEGELWE